MRLRKRTVAGILFIAAHAIALAEDPSGARQVYKRIDGKELHIWTLPPATPSPKAPAIVFFHGGGWVGGTAVAFDKQGQYLASRGMAVAHVEYRLLDRNSKEPPAVCAQDAKSAMRWVRANAGRLGIDPDRIAASGGSAGGHLAAFTALVDGLDDPADDLSVSPKPNALVLFNPVFDNGPGGWGSERVGDEYMKFSPFHHVSAAAPPAIVLSGSDDKLIPADTVRAFQARMRKAGARCDVVIYPGQGHGFFNRGKPYYQTLKAADEFLVSLGWLQGAPAVSVPD